MATKKIYTQCDLEQPEVVTMECGTALVYTHRAPDKASPNEDCMALLSSEPDTAIFILADGLGGLPGGEAASATAVTALSETVSECMAVPGPMRDAIMDGFEKANQSILNRSGGSATTLAVVELQAKAIRPYHVGDSLILLTGLRGRLKLQSVSHSPVGYAVESGMLAQDEAVHHDERHVVSNVVGANDMRIEIGSKTGIAQRDTLLLASDGLMDNLYIDEIVDIIRCGTLEHAAGQLAILARQRMEHTEPGKPSHPDDLSFILFRAASQFYRQQKKKKGA